MGTNNISGEVSDENGLLDSRKLIFVIQKIYLYCVLPSCGKQKLETMNINSCGKQKLETINIQVIYLVKEI